MFGTMVGNQEGSLAFARACVDEKKLRSSPQIAAGNFVIYTPLARAAEPRAAKARPVFAARERQSGGLVVRRESRTSAESKDQNHLRGSIMSSPV